MPLPASGFIRAIRLRREAVPNFDEYPFSIPAIRSLERLPLHPKVTFLIGENGMGKSTLAEALAVRYRINPEGGSRNFNFATRPSHSVLHEYLTIEQEPRYPTECFFLRAESFYNVATHVDQLLEFGPQDEISRRKFINSYGGSSLHEKSHGQSFFAILKTRLRGNGVYIFDEPESALSPQRQMSALTLIDDLVRRGSQFIIATHSPILMSYPEATIYELGENGIRERKYEETEHFQVTRDFLNRHEQMLSILLERLPLRD